MRARVPLQRARRRASPLRRSAREPADRDGHALAIAIELDEARRPNVGVGVHFHAVDNGEEIVTPQTIEVYGFAQTTGHRVPRPPGIEERDFAAPVHKRVCFSDRDASPSAMSSTSRQKAYSAYIASRRWTDRNCIAQKNELPTARRQRDRVVLMAG